VNNTLQDTGAHFALSNAANGMQVYVKMTSNMSCAAASSVNSATIDIDCVINPNAPIDGVELFVITPNPSNGLINIQMKTLRTMQVSFRITDANGHTVYTGQPHQVNGIRTTQIDIRGKTQGIYYLVTTVDNESFVRAVMIAR
jgi:hypothetical protein